MTVDPNSMAPTKHFTRKRSIGVGAILIGLGLAGNALSLILIWRGLATPAEVGFAFFPFFEHLPAIGLAIIIAAMVLM